MRVAKIIFLIFLIGFVTFFIIRFFHLEKLVFRGPKTVVELITDTGLKSDRGHVNILLLGIGGAGHEGPDLSDTMILASVNKNGDDVVLVSIPRDLWAPNLAAKINTAYAFGQEKDGRGLELAKKTVRELFDLPIHYALRLDFAGFERAVDLVEGIDVDVETAFVDSKYPIAGKEDDLCGLSIETVEIDGVSQEQVKDATGSAIPLSEISEENDPFTCRYETISFNQGQTHMNGTTALKFVRSRHGTNSQGSDFARSSRQQKVILAFRQKALSSQTLLNPARVIELTQTFGKSVDTDVPEDDVSHFAKLVSQIDTSRIRRVVLDSEMEDSPLEVGDAVSYSGQFVLVPKGGVWRDLAEYVQGEIFKLDEK